jgi:hypothetical protein
VTSRQSYRRSLRTTIGAVVVVAALVVGAVLVRVSRDSSPNPDRDAESASAEPPRSTSTTGQTEQPGEGPVELVADESGAVTAAAAYATASQRWLYLTDGEITAAVAEIATPTAASRLATDVVADMSMARDQLARSSGRVWWLVRPLAWDVEYFRDTQARVSVWTVTILSAEGVAAPQSEFLTVTLDLAWVDGAWRADGVRDTPGPTPLTGPQDQPWDAEPFDRALDGFTRIDTETVS